MALKAQKMIIFPFIVCPECFLTNILWLVELNDVGKFKVASNDGHLEEIVRDATISQSFVKIGSKKKIYS